ncbi:type II toxin-antitoxin system Phd/YefM family antitoxin [Microaerobacter geothermalis]|nr:type II toxin-antitoxin system Phd/YefM family antitoxin [Microaerobacter geothermalis]MCF6092796.1 type II toxin-antitoxin system Phd/YefM family antitoxin [Microaerobacter geothermalis]
MKTIKITEARKNFYRLVKETITGSELTQILSKDGDVVLISGEDWRSIQETLYLLSIPGMRESIMEADQTPIGEWKTPEDIEWNLD